MGERAWRAWRHARLKPSATRCNQRKSGRKERKGRKRVGIRRAGLKPVLFVCARRREPKDREILRYYHRVKFLIDRYRRLLLLGVLSLIATDLAGIALPWLIKGGIDTALRRQGGQRLAADLPAADSRRGRAARFLSLLLAHQHSWFLAPLRGRSARSWCSPICRSCRSVIFNTHKIGDLMSRLTNDIHAVRELMGFGSLAIVDAAGGDLFQPDADDRHRSLADLVVDDGDAADTRGRARISAGLFFAGRAQPRIKLSDMSAYMLENFSGIRVVQAYAQEENQISGFNRISSEYRRKDHVAGDALGDILAAHAGSRRHRRDHRALARRPASIGGYHEPGRIRRFQRLSGDAHLAAHGDRLHRQSISTRHRGVDAHRRSAGYADRCRAMPVPPLREPAPTVGGDIELRNLTFSYGADQAAELRNINLHIPAGKSLRHRRRDRFWQEHLGQSHAAAL